MPAHPVPCSAFGLRASRPSQTSVLASLRAAVGGAYSDRLRWDRDDDAREAITARSREERNRHEQLHEAQQPCGESTLVRSPFSPGSRPDYASGARSAPGLKWVAERVGGLARSLRRVGCFRPLCRARKAVMRTRSSSPARRAQLAARAAFMRADASPPEQLLWAALTNRKLGVSFRRQVPLGGYICDFVCASRRLVVEVDGAHHRERRRADARRDAVLARLGYRVLRLEAQLVLRDVGVAVGCVAAAL